MVAARVRNDQEETVIRQILATVFKRRVDPEKLFSLGEETSSVTRPLLSASTSAQFPALTWTRDMRRLGVLVAHAWIFQEPVLLVGDTGCGKTTVVQVLARLQQLQLHSLNCHR